LHKDRLPCGYELSDDSTCERTQAKKRDKPVANLGPSGAPDAAVSQKPEAAKQHGPKEYQPQGSGRVSDGNCTCKSICNKFAAAEQLSGAKIAQCKSDCEQKFAGCNKGALR
jgi:hypothetical protein